MGNSAFKTLGGVTPFKKGEKGAGSGKTQVRKVRAGTEGTKARTNRAQDKSGYSRPGADYINVHAFGPNTRVSDSLESTLGPSLSPAVRGMYNFGDTPEIDLIPPVEEEPNGDPNGEEDSSTRIEIEKREVEDPSGNTYANQCYKDGKFLAGKTFMYQNPDPNYDGGNGPGKPYSVVCKGGGTSTGTSHFDQGSSITNQSRELHYKDGKLVKTTDWVDD